MDSSTEQQQELASLYALGALSAERRQAFEAELQSSAELRELVRGLQRAADLLALALPAIGPPPELRDKVLRRLDAADQASRPAAEPLSVAAASGPGFWFHSADDPKGWKELPVHGAWIKLLSLQRERGYAVLLGKLEAGVRYPAHEHLGAEDLFVLSGDLHIGDRALGPGDFHHSDAGTSHGVNYSVAGCTLLAVVPAEHELAQLAMG